MSTPLQWVRQDDPTWHLVWADDVSEDTTYTLCGSTLSNYHTRREDIGDLVPLYTSVCIACRATIAQQLGIQP